ncbi:prolyl oligopeptidase family serine peptidase [Methylobacterium indicum]|uniref:Peptidase S9 n=1 Tax=Methylobacterium indicum TaxID=1775910 RepID=A0ABR5HCK8_9HYPH|nr:prolyl oligopeptidase family serine peptidase [Methylobacterium indicum]KMO14017.1 peptidase S9 [Methylobacterium indicum]KMO23260.1 peptidase S9 [Methylobacterium indicum]
MPHQPDPRPTLQAPDDDPYLWLEEIDGARALAWVEGQNADTLAAYADGRYAADRDGLKAALDRPDKIPGVTRRGGLLYNLWQDAGHPRGLWRRTTEDEYRKLEPAWDVLLDLDALARDEGQDWVWSGAASLPKSHARALVQLSRGGGDATVVREFDLETRTFVEGGFALPEAKSIPVWLDPDTLLLASPLGGPEHATPSGYARTVRLWRRGTDPLDAPVIFSAAPTSMVAYGYPDREANPERLVFAERTGFFDGTIQLGDRTGPKTRLDIPTDADAHWHRGFLAIRLRTPWAVGGTTHPADSVLGIGLDAFLGGSRNFQVLFTPAPRRALQGFFWTGGHLVLSILDDLKAVFPVFTPSASGWAESRVAGLPELGVVSVWSMDGEEEESNGDLMVAANDPVTPSTLLTTRADLAAPTLLKQAPALFEADGMVVTRHEAVSSDGERIPYVQAGPAGETGEAPVHLSGYGGFQVTNLAGYSAVLGRLWLAKGGTRVVANIRGGGEFGTRWHEAGRREGKARTHDDFAAVAADLVRRGVTRPRRIAAEGGSNGGLLIANMLTRYPERFGALFCTVPLIDMRRYTKLLAGASWIAEYGDPAIPEDWAFLQEISAYHVAEAGKTYPPILIATTRRDDRVHPGHARKMAAKLQVLGYDARFYEPEAGGHSHGKNSAETAAFAALGAAFLRRAIGWEPEVAGS